jgi:hypothetical protein
MTPSQRSQHWQKISNSNYRKVHTPTLPAAPPKVNPRTCLAESSNPVLASTMPPSYQTRSQKTIHAQDITNTPLLPTVVTPMMHHPSPPRVPPCSQNLPPPQLVRRRILRHGHCPYVHRPLKSPLVPAAPIQCSRSPHHEKIIGIYGPYERPLSATTLKTRFWSRVQAPFPRHSRHSCNRHMFLYQTHKHLEIQTDHIRQNSLRLKTTQRRKRTSQVDRGRRQARLLRRHHHIQGRHHNIKNPDQKHPFHQGHIHDYDGH